MLSKILPKLHIYSIYSSERRERSFNFWFSKGGAYSREALIKKTSNYFQFVSLINQ